MNDSTKMFESSRTAVEAKVSFDLDGDAPSFARRSGRRTPMRSGEGVATRVESSRLWLTGGGQAWLALDFRLPPSIDFRPLLGKRLRLTLVQEGAGGETLTVNGEDGRVWLIACSAARGTTVHVLGETPVRAALSQRPDGPLVVGTPSLQRLVPCGKEARVAVDAAELVVHFVARSSSGSAAYVIADALLCPRPS